VKTIHHNGERWYTDTRSIARRIREWFLWNPMGLAGPISILGHRATYHGWGFQIKLDHGWILTVSWPHGHQPDWRAYISPNGTPGQATTWFVGTPREILEQAAQHIHPAPPN
jgi:hypothetical protein